MNFTNFITKQRAEESFIKSLENLEQNIDKVHLAISDQKNYLTKNSYQLIASLMTDNDRIKKIFFNELINTCFQLELKCQGSSYFFLKAFISFAKELVKNEESNYQFLIQNNSKEAEKYLNSILKSCRPVSSKEISEIVDEICQDSVISTIIKESTALAGIEGNIVFEESDIPNTIIELQFGYNFKLNSFKGFIPSIGTWTRSNVKILMVDGLIEKVSELDKILAKSYETKIPLLLIAQGFSEEVIATLHANNSRNNFDVMPLRLEQSLESLNVLNDIAVTCGGDIVSSLKGEVLSMIPYDSLAIVEKISITNNILTVHNNSTRGNVVSHLNYLKNRRKEQETNAQVTDLADLTTKRIQNLLAHIVKVSVPKNESNKIKIKLDNALRACRAMYTYGYCSPEKIDFSNLSNEWQKMHKSMLKEVDGNKQKIPTICFYLAASFAANLATSYFTSAGAIVQN